MEHLTPTTVAERLPDPVRARMARAVLVEHARARARHDVTCAEQHAQLNAALTSILPTCRAVLPPDEIAAILGLQT